MQANLLEIAWHDKAPVWSIDISQSNRVVTAGGDKVARVWRLSNTPALRVKPVEWLCDLRAHLTTVNIARFSRSGLAIATAADQGDIVIWRLSFDTDAAAAPTPLQVASEGTDAAPTPQERWVHETTLRGHHQDVLDLCWSSDGSTLISASVDNTINIWDICNPSARPNVIRAHSNYVQGVAIDPLSKVIASLGNDRALRIFSKAGTVPWAQVAVATAITADSKLFANDTQFKTFFRRLHWSPDGSVLACPSGLQFPESDRMFAVHLFARNHWSLPAVQCGGLKTPACAVRFSPVLYALRQQDAISEDKTTVQSHSQSCPSSSSAQRDGEVSSNDVEKNRPQKKPEPFKGFTYRMIFAVVCANEILFYDTDALTRPFATVEGLHCAEHTDVAWSEDGLTVMLSSVDGYVSVITFAKEDLGPRLGEQQMPRWLREYSLQRQHLDMGRLVKATRVIVPSAVTPRSSKVLPPSDSKNMKPDAAVPVKIS